MIRFVIFYTLAALLIQTVVIVLTFPVVLRYKIVTLRVGMVYCFANLLSVIARLIYVFEMGLARGAISPATYILTASIDFVAIYALTISYPRLIHGYLELSFPRWFYLLAIVQPVIMGASVFFLKGPVFLRFLSGVVYVSIPFLLMHLYGVALMAGGLLRKDLFQRKFLIYGLLMGIVYIPIGIVDCLWPYFRTVHLMLPAAFSLSMMTVIFTGLIIIRYAYPYLIKMDSGKKKFSYSGSKKFTFTEREEEVLHLIVGGYTNDQIAAHLQISTSTVKKHIYNMFQKTESENRVDLINSCREAV